MKIEIPAIIRDYAPRWTKQLESKINLSKAHDETKIDGVYIDMSDYTSCIVGEMNCFSDGNTMGREHAEYGCVTCERFAGEFDDYFIANDKESLEDEMKAYALHIKNKHEDKMRKIHEA